MMHHVYLVYIVCVDGHRIVVAACETEKRADAIAKRWLTEKHVIDAYTSLVPIDEKIGQQGLEL